jgi:7,8-dihydro-6-hydroxymethylpterin-pyrophosphokinase
LDVDLLFHDDTRIDSPELTLPHPRFAERRFVLAPLAEVAPNRCPADWDRVLPPDDVRPVGPLRG